MGSTLTRHIFSTVVILALGSVLPCCTHVAGTATWAGTTLPAAGAKLSVGTPSSTFTLNYYPVNAQGRFSFWISPLDTDNIWIWSGQGDPSVDSVQIDPTLISDHMTIQVPRRVVPTQ